MKYIHINTPCGKVRGIGKAEVDIYKGIRFATAGRFEDPELVTSWDGEFDATRDGDACIQTEAFYPPSGMDIFFSNQIIEKKTVKFSEDCLNLNIWTPAGSEPDLRANGSRRDLGSADLPVMVFLYGGAFDTGYNCSAEFDGTEYAKRGVILVTINYRVNAFGSCPGGKWTGNLCLKDTLAALKFIKGNISAFGGDPEKVTLSGESAGAVIAQDMMYIPEADGLFRSALMMSSGGLMPERQGMIRQTDGPALWKNLMGRLGVEKLEDLQDLPAKEIFDVYEKLVMKNKFARASRPFVDDDFVTGTQEELLEKGEFIDVPCLITMLSHDMFPRQLYDALLNWGRFMAAGGSSSVWCALIDYSPDGSLAEHGTDLHYAFGTMDNNWHNNGPEDYALSKLMIDRYAEFVKTGELEGWEPISESNDKFMCLDYEGERQRKLDAGLLLHRQETEPQFPGMDN